MDPLTRRVIRGEGTSEAEWTRWPGLARLPAVLPHSLVAAGGRAVVVAPHPDDEVLSVGGLLALLARAGTPLRIIAVTDGTASHRGSVEWPVERLARVRPAESRQALRQLGVESGPIRLAFPDGGLAQRQPQLAERLAALIGPSDVVFTTWRCDGHPDHEATGQACAVAAARRGARLFEVPVWAWHWAAPGDPCWPWRRALRLPLDADAANRKARAVRAFASQLAPDASTGAPPILRGATLERAARDFEVFFS